MLLINSTRTSLRKLHTKSKINKARVSRTWLPNTINVEDKGMIFANGSNAQNWRWAAVKAIEIPKKDIKKHPLPGKPGQFMKYRMDMKNMKSFEERDYIEALSYIGVLPE